MSQEPKKVKEFPRREQRTPFGNYPMKPYADYRNEIEKEINANKYKPNPLDFQKTEEEKALLKQLKKTSNKTFTQHVILN
jgi:hypothetical protein